MTFADAHLLWLAAAAPLALWLLDRLWRRRLDATAAWAAPALWQRLGLDLSRRRLRLRASLVAITILGVALALAQPRWGVGEVEVERRGVDVVFVVDSSLSMAVADLPPNRLSVARTLVRRMVQRLPGHRVALVLAEGDGMVMVPLTLDAAALDLVLDAVDPATLPIPGTRLGPALELAADLFPEGGEKNRTLVLISDGENHGADLSAAARTLAERRIVVHALGVGTTAGGPIPLPGNDGLKRNDQGRVVISRLEEGGLEALSRPLDGLYLRVESAATDPSPIVARIGRMEKRRFESDIVEELEDRFQWPLAAGALALLGWLTMPVTRTRS